MGGINTKTKGGMSKATREGGGESAARIRIEPVIVILPHEERGVMKGFKMMYTSCDAVNDKQNQEIRAVRVAVSGNRLPILRALLERREVTTRERI